MKQSLKKIIPERLWNTGHFLIAFLGAALYRFPSRNMIVIGITGTNGKSTVVELLHKVFEDFGFRVASFSSLRSKIMGERKINRLKMTMPGRFLLQRFLSEACQKGCQIAILEVTSEGIKQYRHVGINFNVALLTNLRPEHIESHGSFEAYRAAKGRLFKKIARGKANLAGTSIVNLDDPSAFYYIHFPAEVKLGFGLLPENIRAGVKAIVPDDIKFSASGISFSYASVNWKSSLVGDFNLYNILATIAVAQSFKIPLARVEKSIQKIKKIPGRMELAQEIPFRVVIDYAHTPDALESVYRTVRSFWLKPPSKFIAVLGSAGGGRDRWKRPELGQIADRFADFIVLTNEDPYQENPSSILGDIKKGIDTTPYELIVDRREAITYALKKAQVGDVVVITGKGAEKIIMSNEGPVPWDDRKVVREILSAKS